MPKPGGARKEPWEKRLDAIVAMIDASERRHLRRMDASEQRHLRRMERIDARLDHAGVQLDQAGARLNEVGRHLKDFDARLEHLRGLLEVVGHRQDATAKLLRNGARMLVRLEEAQAKLIENLILARNGRKQENN